MGKKKSAATVQIEALISKGKKGKKQKGGGAKKIGRYSKSASCVRYRSEHRWEANRLRRIRRHLRRLPGDTQARSVLDRDGTAEDRAFLASLPRAGKAA